VGGGKWTVGDEVGQTHGAEITAGVAKGVK